MNLGKKTEQSHKIYNEMAWEYDFGPEGHYTRSHKKEIIKKAELRAGDNILDVACGNGYLLENSPKRRELMPLV